jgi:hypothetical protein
LGLASGVGHFLWLLWGIGNENILPAENGGVILAIHRSVGGDECWEWGQEVTDDRILKGKLAISRSPCCGSRKIRYALCSGSLMMTYRIFS